MFTISMDKFVTGLRIKHKKSAELSVTVGQAKNLKKKKKKNLCGFLLVFWFPKANYLLHDVSQQSKGCWGRQSTL